MGAQQHTSPPTQPPRLPTMTRTTFTLMVSAFLLAFVFTARAQSSLWVRPGGCDTAACASSCNGTFECPLDTIQDALDELPYGGTVLLFPGTYSGEGNSNITLKGAQYTINSGQGVQLATIDCGGRPGFTVENGNAIIAGVIVNNCQRPGGKGAAFYLENGSGTIARSYFTSNTATTTGGGIYVTGAQLDLIESNMTGNSPNDIACAGATINQPRPAIETGEVECLGGCNSPLCSA